MVRRDVLGAPDDSAAHASPLDPLPTTPEVDPRRVADRDARGRGPFEAVEIELRELRRPDAEAPAR